MDEVLCARHLVQSIDILRHRQHLASVLLLEAGEGVMRRIRLGVGVAAPAEIVKLVHAGRIAGKALGRRRLRDVELRPQPAFVAERAEPALGPRAGQNDDGVEAHFASPRF
jgi:hypothetical protein